VNTVDSSIIKKLLDQLGLEYFWQPIHPNSEFQFASIFEPINNGFYYCNAYHPILEQPSNSLIILPDTLKGLPSSTNEYIYLSNSNPQTVYYQILSILFKRTSNGTIADTAIVDKEVKLGKNVQIDDFCIIENNCQIGDNVIIGSHTKIHSGTIIEADSCIESMSVIGTQGVAWVWNESQSQKIIQPQLGGVKIGANCFLGANTILVRGSINEDTEIGDGTLIAPGCRIGHGTKIGKNVHLANGIVTGGNTVIGNYCFIGSSAVFRPKIVIHEKTIIGAGSVVVKSTNSPGKTLIGFPAEEKETKENPSGMPTPKL
jgi:UDP-3-O-[3-hydroxymyristoyl] glucosamine N-acyltransferase